MTVEPAAGSGAPPPILPPAAPRLGPARRAIDLVLATVALAACAPVIAWAAVAMRASGDRGPILYRAARVGEGGRQFEILKIRTMRPGAAGIRVTVAGDPRLTRVGRVLRSYRIDELPQLLNVIRGDMSLVGPRPEDPRYVDLEDPLHRFVFTARPGITGPTQLAFRDEAVLLSPADPEADYRARILPAKLRMDADYLRHRTFTSDMRLLVRTAGVVVGRGGEASSGQAGSGASPHH